MSKTPGYKPMANGSLPKMNTMAPSPFEHHRDMTSTVPLKTKDHWTEIAKFNELLEKKLAIDAAAEQRRKHIEHNEYLKQQVQQKK